MKMHLLHAAMMSTNARWQVEIAVKNGQRSNYKSFKNILPVSRMQPVPLRFGLLNLNRKTHHNRTTESDSLVYKFNRTEFNVANTAIANKSKPTRKLDKAIETYPFERLEIRSVTIRESITAPSPNFSSKK